MVEFLVRRFVRNYGNMEDVRVGMAYGTLTSMVRIGCNLLLSVSKLCIGILVYSISVMADTSNNLSDVVSSIIGFMGIEIVEEPAGDDHPFGYGRTECVAVLIMAFLVVQAGSSLFKTSFDKVLYPEDMSFRWISILILLMSMGIELWLSCLNRKLGRCVNSKVMLAASADALDDVATTSVTICSVGTYGALGLNVDGIMGFIVSMVVMIAGMNIVKDTLTPLIGEAINLEIYDKITGLVESFDGIVDGHDLIVHNCGSSRSMALIHAEVPNDCDMERTHEIVDHTGKKAVRRMRILLVIHMDLMETHDERVVEFKELVTSVLDSVDNRFTFCDFRMVGGAERVNLIFDLVVPREYKPPVLGKLKTRTTEDVAKKDRRCCYVITTRSSFISESRE